MRNESSSSDSSEIKPMGPPRKTVRINIAPPEFLRYNPDHGDDVRHSNLDAITRRKSKMFGGTVIAEENFNGFDFVNRHDVKVDEFLRQRPAYNFVHHFHAWIKPIFSEFFASFIFLFWLGLCLPTDSNASPLIPALSVGLGATALIITFWDICIIQFNPAVTIALVAGEALPWRLLFPNIVAQLTGSLAGAALAHSIRGEAVGAAILRENENIGSLFASNFIFVAILLFFIMNAVLVSHFSLKE